MPISRPRHRPPGPAPAGPERLRWLDRDRFDAIVIGAGTGGLTAAALLARRGRQVLVIDRHYVAGGNATVFRRRGYQFDVGLHYLGDCGPNGSVRRILRAAGIEDVSFRALDPDGFDTLVFPHFTFRVPRGYEAYRERLLDQFPSEARGIDRYLGVLRGLHALQGMGSGGSARALASLWRGRAVLLRLGGTLGSLLEGCTRDPRLRAVLSAQSGVYAEPPSRASLVAHALIMDSYLDGAYYPAGGAQVISDRLAAAVERSGGKILLLSEVTRVVIEEGRVAGVEIESHHLGRLTVRAPVVISDADFKRTLLGLVGEGHLRPGTVRRTRAYEMAPATGVVFLGVRRDLRAEGVPNTNFWIHRRYDQEEIYAWARMGRFHPDPICYVSSATLKDPENPRVAPPGMSNLELMTVAPSTPEAWGVTEEEVASGAYRHVRRYAQAKEAFALRLIDAAERVFPGLSGQIDYLEVATPLTHARMTGSTGGTGYGLASIPSQFLWRRPGHATEVPGLYLCGASTMTGHGIQGTMWSGVLAASRIAGRELLAEVMSGAA